MSLCSVYLGGRIRKGDHVTVVDNEVGTKKVDHNQVDGGKLFEYPAENWGVVTAYYWGYTTLIYHRLRGRLLIGE